MCRLFGFRSVIKSQMHRSLVSADNALVRQSEEHPDGWGVAYYQHDVPHLVKTADTAVADSIFQRVSGVVSSQTVVAHLRKATCGELSMINSHPFQHGRWVFAHNGNVPDFEGYREDVEALVAPALRSFILGDTDSEVLFYLLLTNLQKRADLGDTDPSFDALTGAVRETVDAIRGLTGRNCYEPTDRDDDEALYLSFLLTDGQSMIAHQGGKPLHMSTHKTRCPDRDACSSFAPICEQPTTSGQVNHLLIASEPLNGENVWRPMEPGQIVGVDADMDLTVTARDGTPAQRTNALRTAG
jgi:glutamine amidotransferase